MTDTNKFDEIKQRYADLRHAFLSRNISAIRYVKTKHQLDDEFEKMMGEMEKEAE